MEGLANHRTSSAIGVMLGLPIRAFRYGQHAVQRRSRRVPSCRRARVSLAMLAHAPPMAAMLAVIVLLISSVAAVRPARARARGGAQQASTR